MSPSRPPAIAKEHEVRPAWSRRLALTALLVVPLAVPTAAAQVPELPPELPIVFDSWEVVPETVGVQTPIDFRGRTRRGPLRG